MADENVPFKVIESLRKAGYDVATIGEVTHPGIRNDELAKVSIRLRMIILTRDADFTHLRQPLMRKIKVVCIRLIGDPNNIAQQVLNNIAQCTDALQDHNAVMLAEEGLHAL